MMTPREAVKEILEGRSADIIPVVMNADSLPPARYGYSAADLQSDPEKGIECKIGTRRDLGYDGLCAGGYLGVSAVMAGHLPNPAGIVTGVGAESIQKMEDLEKLNPYDPEKDMMLKGLLYKIEKFHELEPDQPVYVIAFNPAGAAFELFGGRHAFRTMVKDPELYKAAAKALEPGLIQACNILTDAGVDFIWIPMPNFGGYCISRDMYINCISESNIRFNTAIMEHPGAHLVIHTCGLYDDRFDLVAKEKGQAWHISDTKTSKVKNEWGDQVAIMGNIPSVPMLLEKDAQANYDFAYEECIENAKDGRFILSADCDVSPLTPDDHIEAVVRAARDAEKVLFA